MSTATPIKMSANAAKRIAFLAAQEGKPDLKLRIGVDGGGCSGFQYAFNWADSVADDDIVVERDGATVVVDSTSLLYMIGSEIDFVEDLVGSSFRINNPNVQASCGCGTSFSV